MDLRVVLFFSLVIIRKLGVVSPHLPVGKKTPAFLFCVTRLKLTKIDFRNLMKLTKIDWK